MTVAGNQQTLTLTRPPVASTGMLIRRPVTEVFEAFVDPAVTTRFWFTRGSGRLSPGDIVQWEWEMYNISVNVRAIEVVQNRRICIEWWMTDQPATTVEWQFTPLQDDTTFVAITESGFTGTGDEVSGRACNSSEGFSFALASLKAFMELGVTLNLVRDRFPTGLQDAQKDAAGE